jgi:hypothetical protein
VKITIDTAEDTFDGAIAAVHAAYGVPPDGGDRGDGGEEVDLDDEQNGGEDFFPGKWTRKRIRKLAQWVTGLDAGVALKYMAEHAPAVDIDEVLAHMAKHTGDPNFNGQHMGGRMSSVGFAQNAIGAGVGAIYDTDYKHRKYRMDKGIAKVLLEELEAAKKS